MRSFCLFFLILLFNALFCVGNPRRDRRPDALSHTSVRKRVVRYSADKYIVSSSMPKRFSAKKSEYFKAVDLYVSNKVKTIGSIYLFPNKYEFQAVYNCLLAQGATDIKSKELGMVFKRLYLQRSENMSLALVQFNGKRFCMATCGEGTYELLQFCQRCFDVFRNLKTVFLGGICGCSSDKVFVGDVLVSENYNYIKKISIGDAEDRNPSPVSEKATAVNKSIQVGNFYVYEKDCIKTPVDLSLLVEARKSLEKNGIVIHEGIDCSLDAFVDREDFCLDVARSLSKQDDGGIVFFNMEDGQIADQCANHNCKFYAFRVVSDHAGRSPREFIEGGKKDACERLGEVFTLLFDFFSKEHIF